MADMKSSSESMPLLAIVTGVGGAILERMAVFSSTLVCTGAGLAAEAILLLGSVSFGREDNVASAAFLFLVTGGMVASLTASPKRVESRGSRDAASGEQCV